MLKDIYSCSKEMDTIFVTAMDLHTLGLESFLLVYENQWISSLIPRQWIEFLLLQLIFVNLTLRAISWFVTTKEPMRHFVIEIHIF